MKKRYFDSNDRKLILEIKEKYKEKMKKEKIEEINKYLKITDIKRSRFSRFILSLDFKINLKKRLFLLLKG